MAHMHRRIQLERHLAQSTRRRQDERFQPSTIAIICNYSTKNPANHFRVATCATMIDLYRVSGNNKGAVVSLRLSSDFCILAVLTNPCRCAGRCLLARCFAGQTQDSVGTARGVWIAEFIPRTNLHTPCGLLESWVETSGNV